MEKKHQILCDMSKTKGGLVISIFIPARLLVDTVKYSKAFDEIVLKDRTKGVGCG